MRLFVVEKSAPPHHSNEGHPIWFWEGAKQKATAEAVPCDLFLLGAAVSDPPSRILITHQRLWFPPHPFRAGAFLLAAEIQSKKNPTALIRRAFSVHFEAVDCFALLPLNNKT